MNKEDILLLTDKGLAVFKYYIPFAFKLGRNFLNPLYKDSKASVSYTHLTLPTILLV